MRPLTGEQERVLAGRHYASYARFEVRDDDGAGWLDLSPWFEGVAWGYRQDEPIPHWSVSLGREHHREGSLSPLINPQRIDIGRRARVLVATVPEGADPSGHYVTATSGIIDRTAFASDPIQVTGRGVGYQTGTRWIERETVYGTGSGRLLHLVMRDILNDWAPDVTLVVPRAPGLIVRPYTQQPMAVQEALQQLATLIGWVVRPHWDPGTGTHQLHLVDPERDKTRIDWTLGPDDYFDVTQLDLDLEDIRNVIQVRWRTSGDPDDFAVEATVDASVRRYDRMWAEFVQGEESPIDTEPEARAFARAAVSDLAFPEAEQTIETKFLWPVEVGDLLRFKANGVHYEHDQRWAVVAVSHELGVDRDTTHITVRGKPAGNYRAWRAVVRVRAKDPDPFGHAEILFLLAIIPNFRIVAFFNFYGNRGLRSFRWSATKRSGAGAPPDDVTHLVNGRQVEFVDTGVGALDFGPDVGDGAGNGDTVWLLIRGYAGENGEGREGERIVFQRDFQRDGAKGLARREDRLRRYAATVRGRTGASATITELMIPHDFK